MIGYCLVNKFTEYDDDENGEPRETPPGTVGMVIGEATTHAADGALRSWLVEYRNGALVILDDDQIEKLTEPYDGDTCPSS